MKRVGFRNQNYHATAFIFLTLVVALVLTGCQQDFQAQAAKLSGNRALVIISSQPSGASVYFNGTFKGTTPRKLIEAEDAYDIQIKKRSYATFEQSYSFVLTIF